MPIPICLTAPLDTKHEDYLKKEVDKLNKELEKLLDETRTREKYSITIIAGIAAWLFLKDTPSNPNLLNIVSCIPIITTALFALSVYFLSRNIAWIGTYLHRVENYFLHQNPYCFGWEAESDKANRRKNFVNLSKIMWGIQLVCAIGLCIYVTNCKPTIQEKPKAAQFMPLPMQRSE